MPRKTLVDIGGVKIAEDATNQDIIDTLDSNRAEVISELETATHEMKRTSRALELLLNEEVEV